jgi:hypothetical protein
MLVGSFWRFYGVLLASGGNHEPSAYRLTVLLRRRICRGNQTDPRPVSSGARRHPAGLDQGRARRQRPFQYRWFGHPITVLRDEKYGASALEVFRRKRYLKGQRGAPCRKALKGDVLDAASLPSDIFALGYTAEEEDRVLEFQDANNGRQILCPLIEKGLSKADCLAMIERAGIELPAMYRLGYNNNNCRLPGKLRRAR